MVAKSHKYFDGDADKILGLSSFGSRYGYDSTLPALGWKQYDTKEDAWYFGVWVHLEKRSTFCYAEGDRQMVVCDTEEEMREELDRMAKFYGPPPPAMIIYDENGRTEVYDERPTLGNPSPLAS